MHCPLHGGIDRALEVDDPLAGRNGDDIFLEHLSPGTRIAVLCGQHFVGQVQEDDFTECNLSGFRLAGVAARKGKIAGKV